MQSLRLMRCLLVTLCAGLAACSAQVGYHEVERVPSADRSLDAVLSESDSRARSPVLHRIQIVPAGAPPIGNVVASFSGATRSASALGVGMAWSGPLELEVRYFEAGSARVDEVALARIDARLRVVLTAGVVDPQAAAGRMARDSGSAVQRLE